MLNCVICRENNSLNYYLEGHRVNDRVYHVFDSECIRAWLNIEESCPTCREALSPDQLIRVGNPHFSSSAWLGRKWEQITSLSAEEYFNEAAILATQAAIVSYRIFSFLPERLQTGAQIVNIVCAADILNRVMNKITGSGDFHSNIAIASLVSGASVLYHVNQLPISISDSAGLFLSIAITSLAVDLVKTLSYQNSTRVFSSSTIVFTGSIIGFNWCAYCLVNDNDFSLKIKILSAVGGLIGGCTACCFDRLSDMVVEMTSDVINFRRQFPSLGIRAFIPFTQEWFTTFHMGI